MAFTWSRVKPRYLMPPSQGGCIIWQPEREWGGTREPWEREGSARSGRGKSRAWPVLGLADSKGGEGAHGTHDWKVGVGTVKNPKLQNPESWVRAKASARVHQLRSIMEKNSYEEIVRAIMFGV